MHPARHRNDLTSAFDGHAEKLWEANVSAANEVSLATSTTTASGGRHPR
jgi:hypothetical protein